MGSSALNFVLVFLVVSPVVSILCPLLLFLFRLYYYFIVLQILTVCQEEGVHTITRLSDAWRSLRDEVSAAALASLKRAVKKARDNGRWLSQRVNDAIDTFN